MDAIANDSPGAVEGPPAAAARQSDARGWEPSLRAVLLGSALALAAAACTSSAPTEMDAPETGASSRVSALDPEGVRRESRLLALLDDFADRADERLAREETALLRAALPFAGDRARTLPRDTLVALVRHQDATVRSAALGATEALAARGAIESDVALEVEWLAAFDPADAGIRSSAALRLAARARSDRFVEMHLRAASQVADPMAALLALMGLRVHGVDTGSLVAGRFGAEPRSSNLDHLVVRELQRSPTPEAEALLLRIATESTNEFGARLARAALAARESAGWQVGPPPTHRPLEGDLEWVPASKARLWRSLRATRLAFFGEVHTREGPLRKAQRDAIERFAEGGGQLFLGYEPSVQASQQPVIDHAIALGFEAISTEPGIDLETIEVLGHERDTIVARTVNARLASSPDARVFVLRGETHLQPGGHLDALIDEPTVVIHFGNENVPLLVADPRLELVGPVYASEIVEGLFTWFCHPTPATRPPDALIQALTVQD